MTLIFDLLFGTLDVWLAYEVFVKSKSLYHQIVDVVNAEEEHHAFENAQPPQPVYEPGTFQVNAATDIQTALVNRTRVIKKNPPGNWFWLGTISEGIFQPSSGQWEYCIDGWKAVNKYNPIFYYEYGPMADGSGLEYVNGNNCASYTQHY